ncbi:hypothetical protein HMPREF0620_0005 [Parascardovia denticolens DSM 10105 = JCM 12538]|uniref:GtrA/DPMS transmembrane domain-containing protein n=1 Tax=Parascardovia denticolens DSM 10105 = JCM 12538 TaxID=864564 RepID=E6JYE1_PARDN|nr:GtrA family protein [Parascardovia denticolens]EFG32674.1 hypothetical protein HMPREF9017_00071 [Parascardovia denticolens F0305]EFT83000.1 hypothetical protein HMPREF0620_0005 [Parascardovia denticolens DSM 10105 = JCM 12538]BAR04533.1 conserved hypothetical protein [Parascardovia denticolens DSM 10105 = JCM 12538]
MSQTSNNPTPEAPADLVEEAAKQEKKNRNPFKKLTDRYPNLWEFILFNLLSNISTITRFALVWLGTWIFVHLMHLTQPFSFLIFNYSTPKSNGLGGFITFLITEVAAQVVNFFVQMKWVFKSDSSFKQAAWKYALLAILIVVVNLILPGWLTNLFRGWGMNDGLSSTMVSVVNTLLAVIVSYPLLKWWIMPKSKEHEAEIKKAKEEAKAEAEAK